MPRDTGGLDASCRESAISRAASLSAFAAGPLHLPASAIAIAQRGILETVVLGLAGSTQDGIPALARLARDDHSAGPSMVWDGGPGLSSSGAALVNATSASALDYDSLYASVHSDAMIVPIALAVGEAVGASGRQVLEAYAVGVEIMARLARAAEPPQRGWTHTAVFGVFGAAATAGRLMKLPAERLNQAFGVALSLAAGSQQTNVEQVLTKRLQPGLAARSGIFAAGAVREGFTAPADWLQGRAGLWHLYQPGDAQRVCEGLGEIFYFTEAILKAYPVCSCSHAAIEALRRILQREPLAPDAIESVTVELTPFMAHMVGAPFSPGDNPVVTAQFSVAYGLACIALRGRLSLADLETNAILDPAIRAFADRVAVRVDEAGSGELAPATVTVSAGGRQLSERVEIMPGTPEAPMSAAALDAKLADCLALVRDARPGLDLDRIRQAVDRLPEMDCIADFSAALS